MSKKGGKLYRLLDWIGEWAIRSDLIGGKERALASKHTARNLLAAAFSSVASNDFGNARGFLERADREVKRLREEGCDDIDVPEKKQVVRRVIGAPLAWFRKRKESKECEEETECEAPERSRPMKFVRKALLLLALPVAGALTVQHSDKLASLMPDTVTATRAEFQIADACVACLALSDHAETPAAFCKECGATEVKQIVAAKLHAGVWGFATHVGWQLQDGQTLLLEEDAEYEVPPLRVKSESTKVLTRF